MINYKTLCKFCEKKCWRPYTDFEIYVALQSVIGIAGVNSIIKTKHCLQESNP